MVKKIGLLFFIVFLSSCSLRNKEIKIDLLEDKGYLAESYAVVVVPYVSFYREPSLSASVTAHCRKGDIFEIKAVRFVPENGKKVVWYDCDKGWTFDKNVKVYSNKLRAFNAAKELK